MALAVEADLAITIDGQDARLSGSGRTLTLQVATPVMLRNMLQVSLPEPGEAGGRKHRLSRLPKLLERLGITLVVADKQGPLLIVGADAAGKSYQLPFVGTLEGVALASKRAALRLVFSA